MWRVFLFLLAATSAIAQTDPLDAPECRAAMAALKAAEQGASGPPLKDAQRRAARECLGARADPPPAARRAEPPVAVPPLTFPAPRPAPPATATPPPPVTVRPMPPPAVVTCDAATCLTTDGQRLLRSGPTLIGPQGQCQVQAGVVVCP